MTDVIDVAGELSIARTALDDPASLPDLGMWPSGGPTAIAIDKIDRALRVLRPDHEPDELVPAMSFYGRALAGIADELEARGLSSIASLIHAGLDNLDAAIEAAKDEAQS